MSSTAASNVSTDNDSMLRQHRQGLPGTKAWFLFVLEGANKGARLHLQEGQYVLGRSLNADLVINDAAIEDEHLRLFVTRKGVDLEPIAQGITINDYPAKRSRLHLETGWVIRFGSTVICIGTSLNECAQRRSTPTAGLGQQDAAWLNEPASEADPTAPSQPHMTSSSGKRVNLLVIGLALIISLFATKYWIDQSRVSYATGSATEHVEKLISDLGLSDALDVSLRRDNVVMVSGYVRNAEQRDQLSRALKDIQTPVETRLWSNDDLVRAAETVLLALGGNHLDLNSGTPGELIVSGFIPHRSQWQEMKETLLADMPRIKTLRDQNIETLEDRQKSLEKMLSETFLGEKVQVSPDNNQLILEGTVSEGEKILLEIVLNAYKERFANLPEITDKTLALASEQLRLPIKSVTIVGDIASLQLRDGSSYIEGSMLPNGMTLKHIAVDKITLEKDGTTLDYELGES